MKTGFDVDFGSSPEFESCQSCGSSKVFGLWGSERLGLVEQGVGRAGFVGGRFLAGCWLLKLLTWSQGVYVGRNDFYFLFSCS